MRASDPISPVAGGHRLRHLVAHRRAAYLDALGSSSDPEVIRRRWIKYDEARRAAGMKR